MVIERIGTMKVSNWELICQASADFLTKEIPSELHDEECILKWIDDHRWEPFESSSYSNEQIYELIVASAESWTYFIEQRGGDVVDSVDSASERNGNVIHLIRPYLYYKIWVFDDPTRGLVREALVAGIPEMLEELLAQQAIKNPQSGFNLMFSHLPFPGHQKVINKLREDRGGTWYKDPDNGNEGWLCPALLLYFSSAPESIYVSVS